MRKFSASVRQHLDSQQKQTGNHPKADLLIAFAERNLSRRERAAIFAHLAECPECREVLALSTGVSTHDAASPHHLAKEGPRWWGWRLSATAAAICAVIATVWGLYFLRSSPTETSSPKAVALSRPPSAPAPPISKAVEPAPAKPKILARRKKQVPRRQDATELAERSPSPPAAKPANDAEKPSEPVAGFAQQAEAQAAPPRPAAAPAPTSTAAPATRPEDVLVPDSMFSDKARAAGLGKFRRAPRNDEQRVWRLEPSPTGGTVQRSDDGGRTWRATRVNEATQLYALSATGSNVWVGGARGKLFHSVDGGVHWTAIVVTDEDTRLTGAVIGIDVRGESITLRTDSGTTWATDDGGAHWHRQ